MSTRSVIGEIRNGVFKGVYIHFDGYPSGVGSDIKAWLAEHEYNVEAFLARMFEYSQWRNLEEGYPETKGDIPEYTSIDQISQDVMIEYVYVFNVDTQTFYVCDKNYEAKKVLVIGESSFSSISEFQVDSLSEYEDMQDEDEEYLYRKMPELTLTGTQESSS